VLIVGDGYSGSTLLDLLLGSHSAMAGLGEVDDFDAFVEHDAFCTCRRPQRDCPFWSTTLARLGGPAFRLRLPGSTVHDVVDRTARLLRAAQDAAGVERVVDSSKRPRRARLLWESAKVDAWAVHLVRDGRAVGWAHVKRGEPFRPAVEHWARRNAEVDAWLQAGGSPPSVRVRYERLATQPETVLDELCRFLGLPFEPAMLRFCDGDHHQVGGNLMRFGTDDAIRLDEEWRDRLTADDFAVFDDVVAAADVGRWAAELPT
jgi:hypothetical protein